LDADSAYTALSTDNSRPLKATIHFHHHHTPHNHHSPYTLSTTMNLIRNTFFPPAPTADQTVRPAGPRTPDLNSCGIVSEPFAETQNTKFEAPFTPFQQRRHPFHRQCTIDYYWQQRVDGAQHRKAIAP
jgi:hypothetical protein